MGAPLSRTGYVVTIPVRIESDDECSTSSGEEADSVFPDVYFEEPLKHFRLVPAPKKVKKDQDGETGKVDEGTKKVRRGEVRTGLVPAAKTADGAKSDIVQRAVKRVRDLYKQFTDESFRTTAQGSQEAQKERLRLVLGLNKMRSISRSRNGSVGKVMAAIGKDKDKPAYLGFFWDGVYEEKAAAGGRWKACSFDRVRSFYRQLKTVNQDTANAFRNGLEAKRSHQVPYRGLRQKLAQSDAFMQQVTVLRAEKRVDKVYMGIFDADSITLRAKDGRGVFSHYDEMVQQHPKLVMGSCGYLFTGQKTKDCPVDPIPKTATEFDLRIRHTTGRYFPYGIYYPEPSFILLVPQSRTSIPYSFETREKHYSSPQESVVILEQIKKQYNGDPDVVCFNRKGAIVSCMPARAEKPYAAHYNAYKLIVRWTQRDIKRMRGVAQSHLHPKKWADSLMRALSISAMTFTVDGEEILVSERTVRNMAASLIARLFNHYNVISMTEERLKSVEGAMSTEGFVSLLLSLLDSYKPDEMRIAQVARKPLANPTDASRVWKVIDQISTLREFRKKLCELIGEEDAKKVESAAKECGKEVLKVFRKNFETRFAELSLALMRDYLKELNPEHGAQIDALKPTPSAAMILDNRVLTLQETLQADFTATLRVEPARTPFNLMPMHWAAITGNRLLVHLLKGLKGAHIRFSGIHAQTAGGATPLHCAIKYCADNAIDLSLIRELTDETAVGQEDSDQTLPLIMALGLLDKPAGVVEVLLSYGALDEQYHEPLLTALQRLHPAQCGAALLNSLLLYLPDEELELISVLLDKGLLANRKAYAVRDEDVEEMPPSQDLLNMEGTDRFTKAHAVPLAVRRGNVALVKKLIEHEAKVCNVFDDEGYSPIMAAIVHLEEPREMAELLIKHGAKVLEANKNGEAPPLRYLLDQPVIDWELVDYLAEEAEDEKGFGSFYFETGAHGHGGIVDHMMSHAPELTARLSAIHMNDRDLAPGTRAVLRVFAGYASDIDETSTEYSTDSDASSELGSHEEDLALSSSSDEHEDSLSFDGTT